MCPTQRPYWDKSIFLHIKIVYFEKMIQWLGPILGENKIQCENKKILLLNDLYTNLSKFVETFSVNFSQDQALFRLFWIWIFWNSLTDYIIQLPNRNEEKKLSSISEVQIFCYLHPMSKNRFVEIWIIRRAFPCKISDSFSGWQSQPVGRSICTRVWSMFANHEIF